LCGFIIFQLSFIFLGNKRRLGPKKRTLTPLGVLLLPGSLSPNKSFVFFDWFVRLVGWMDRWFGTQTMGTALFLTDTFSFSHLTNSILTHTCRTPDVASQSPKMASPNADIFLIPLGRQCEPVKHSKQKHRSCDRLCQPGRLQIASTSIGALRNSSGGPKTYVHKPNQRGFR
jgi:hypothetical protein